MKEIIGILFVIAITLVIKEFVDNHNYHKYNDLKDKTDKKN